MGLQPFWESIYSDGDAPNVFGDVSPGIIELAHSLYLHSRVLDLGSDDGRNALFLAAGHNVLAVDVSAAALSKLKQRAAKENLTVRVTQQDLCN